MSISTEIARIQTDRNTIRTKLTELGLASAASDLDDLAAAAMADVCTGGNPRPCTHELVLGIYKTAF